MHELRCIAYILALSLADTACQRESELTRLPDEELLDEVRVCDSVRKPSRL